MQNLIVQTLCFEVINKTLQDDIRAIASYNGPRLRGFRILYLPTSVALTDELISIHRNLIRGVISKSANDKDINPTFPFYPTVYHISSSLNLFMDKPFFSPRNSSNKSMPIHDM